MAAKIEKTTIIGDVLDIAPETAPLFMAIGKFARYWLVMQGALW